MYSMSGCDIRLVFTFLPKDSTQNAYTSEITFLALVPWDQACLLGFNFVKHSRLTILLIQVPSSDLMAIQTFNDKFII